MERSRGLMWSVLCCAMVLAVGAGCASGLASAPAATLSPAKALQPGDLAKLAGEWEGQVRGSSGPGQFGGPPHTVKVIVGPDGKFTSDLSGQLGQGSATITDGKLVYSGSFTSGVATLHERDGKQVLRGEGKLVGIDGTSQFEVTKR
jgi:hypothetical protein